MLIDDGSVWAGTEAGLHLVRAAEEGMAAKLRAGGYEDDEEKAGPRLLEVSDGVATIAIKGPLVNSDSPYLEYFGVTGYPEIREALIAAAEDSTVEHIVLDVDSGGGAVSGVDDTAKLIRMISDRVKPISTYADNMASAAYWLGASAGEVYAGKASMVGSIGVIATFKEISERNKMEGITATVIRAGKHKALANPNEKLTPAAEAQIQKMVDAAYGVFVEHVANMRGKSYEYADTQMADGKEFIGQEAVDVGLLDGVTTFDQLMSTIKNKVIDSSNNSMDNRGKPRTSFVGESGTTLSGEPDMSKKALTEQDIAAMAAGASALTAEATATPVDAGTPVVDTSAETTAIELSVSTEAAQAVVDAAIEKVDVSATTIQLLNSQLATKDEALLQAGIKISKLEDQVAATSATADPLREIACKSINNMRVALNMASVDMNAMSGVQIVAEHAALTEQFAAKFKVGGIAAVSAETSQETVIDPRHTARVNAARFTK